MHVRPNKDTDQSVVFIIDCTWFIKVFKFFTFLDEN